MRLNWRLRLKQVALSGAERLRSAAGAMPRSAGLSGSVITPASNHGHHG